MTTRSKVMLAARRVGFLSVADEAAFFRWLEQLNELATVSGGGNTLLIEIASDKLGDDQLRELIALFHRYRIEMRQLVVFESRSNKAWLRNQRAYWHQAMYETAPAS